VCDDLSFQLGGTPEALGGLDEIEVLNPMKVCQITGEPDASMVTYFEAVVNTQVCCLAACSSSDSVL